MTMILEFLLVCGWGKTQEWVYNPDDHSLMLPNHMKMHIRNMVVLHSPEGIFHLERVLKVGPGFELVFLLCSHNSSL